MKKLIAIIAIVNTSSMVFGQTTLPTGWNFDDPAPTGWVESLDNNPGLTRYTNGQSGAACKLDGDDEYVLVNFSDVAGTVHYYIKGQGAALTNDVFTIEESADGTTWSTLRELVGTDIDNNGFVEYTDSPAVSTRFIRFYFTDKQSGRNIALDEITIEPMAATSQEEISVSSATSPVVNNSTLVIGNQPSVTLTIANVNLAGGDTLNISSALITGPDASDFSLAGLALPATVDAASSIDFEVNFGTIGNGTRQAVLTIDNDDANGDESTYIINLYGIGGDYATEPSAQPVNLAFADVATYGFDVSFMDASAVPDNYIVTRSVHGAALAAPVDGQTYVKGDYIDPVTQVVHVGSAESFRPSYVMANTEYKFETFSFNGPTGYENYLTDAPLSGNVTTPENMIGDYYQGIDPASADFLTDLQNMISSPYDQTYYSNYAPVMLGRFNSRDTTGGQKVITGVYSGFQYLYSGAFFFDVLSREHTWPHSWMPTYPDVEGMEYSDLHNLFPVHQDEANAVRSNRPLGEVVSVASTFLDATYGDDANGNRVYEPRDQQKGDAARAIFYMAAKWNGTGGNWGLRDTIDYAVTYGQDQDVLKKWHWQDPPDQWEMARNDFIEAEQGNRNPFVDSVNWVCNINFHDMTYIGQPEVPCMTTPQSVGEVLDGELTVSPNPSDGMVALTIDLDMGQQLTIDILDISGRKVATQTDLFRSGLTKRYYDLRSLRTGMYLFEVSSGKGSKTLKLILN